MNHFIKKLTLFFILPSFLLVGCSYNPFSKTAEQPVVNSPINTNTPEPSTDTSPIDTSDWKTYENEEYGFSFKYPSDWTIKAYGMNVGLYNNEDILDTNINNKIVDPLIWVEIFTSKNIIPPGMDMEEALKLEDGREPLPLIEDTYVEVNAISAYRAYRGVMKGEEIGYDKKITQHTRVAIEYNFRKNQDLVYLWSQIAGENNEGAKRIVDTIAMSFSFTQ